MRPAVYVDNNATTRPDPRVVEAMLPFLGERYGNASSAHALGWEAEAAVEEARREVAELIGADRSEIFFTSGATESNNWVLSWAERRGAGVYTSPVEHESLLRPGEHLLGEAMRLLAPAETGQVSVDALPEAPRVGDLVSLMAVNNEVHACLDVAAVAAACHARGLVFHTDAAQAVGRVPVAVRAWGVHLLSLSAHKLYGPKGIGALYVAEALHGELTPLLFGGGQQQGMRSGTIPVFLAVGLGAACKIAREELDRDRAHATALAERFLARLRELDVPFALVGPSDLSKRQPGGLCLEIEGVLARQLCELLPDVALSAGSACSSRGTGSHVLEALGVDVERALGIFRVCFGRFNQADDATYVAERIAEVRQGVVRRLVGPSR